MLAIVRKLGQFRGESHFTTWAYKFVMLEVSAQLGRRFRQHAAVQLGDEGWDRIPDRLGIDPALHAESVELAEALRAAVAGSLSERQRRVFVALAVDGVPLDALAAELERPSQINHGSASRAHRTPAWAHGRASRSPAGIGMSMVLSFGASGQTQRLS